MYCWWPVQEATIWLRVWKGIWLGVWEGFWLGEWKGIWLGVWERLQSKYIIFLQLNIIT